MEYSDFQRNTKEAGLSIADLARLLKQNPNSITNYSHLGYVPSHLAVIAVLMRELAKNGIPFVPLLESLDLKPKASRGRPLAPATRGPKKPRGST
jgi:hypothetical protein